MINQYQELKSQILFDGMSAEEIEKVTRCLGAYERYYEKDAYIYHSGATVHEAGIIVSGSVCIVDDDFFGNRSIIAKLGAEEIFAESYACSGKNILTISVIAAEQTRILFVNCAKLLTVCSETCAFHRRMVMNFARILAEKNMRLNRKIEHVTKRTTREKLISYLSHRAEAAGTRKFEIPFNRQQLADYLAVDRSAMSSELCRLRDEGLLRFNRNSFELIERDVIKK